ncbi:MAG: hypothetical protein JNM06_07560 [Blastocatellia bacterium]|nr:hypothetical protein [Blastocatellia bacterium]
MNNFEDRLQEQIKSLVNTHLSKFEKEVTDLQQSVQDLVKNSFNKLLDTATQDLSSLTTNENFSKLAEELIKELVAEKTSLLSQNSELVIKNEQLSLANQGLNQEKVQLEILNQELTKEKADLSAEKTKLAEQTLQASESKTSTNLALLKVSINEIQSHKTQSDVLTALVSQASSFSPRVALFIVKSGNAIGWLARGFENDQTNIKGVSIPLQSDTVLRAVLGKQITFIGAANTHKENQILFSRFNNSVPTQVAGVPLLVRGKAAAVLYADASNLSGDAINLEALEILVNMAGLAIELISIRPRSPETGIPQSTTQSVQSIEQPAKKDTPLPVIPAIEKIEKIEEEPKELVAPPPIIEKAPEPEIPAALPLPIIKPVEPKIESFASNLSPIPRLSSEDLLEPKKAELPTIPTIPSVPSIPSFSADLPPEVFISSPGVKTPSTPKLDDIASLKSSANLQIPKPNSLPEIKMDSPSNSSTPSWNMSADFSPPPPSPPTWQTPPDFAKPSESFAFVPPPPAPPVVYADPLAKSAPGQVSKQAKPIPANDEEQKLHNDAKRFARLLVSEIKLYNEQKVLDGRRNSDLYDRLKEDIDRSRQMYDKRVSALVAAKYDYFYDELVNTLAEGDEVKLGKDCPGPSLQLV